MFKSAIYMGLDCVSMDTPAVARLLVDHNDPLSILIAEEDADDFGPPDVKTAKASRSARFSYINRIIKD